jgi:prepilin-type N-terminal cleavage/methylation domain-containing protein
MTRPRTPGQDGFTLLEVLVTLAILAYAVVGFQAVVHRSVELALVTKIHRQLRHLVDYQMGQITVGKLHPDEEDPFPDGQTGSFHDVGGYEEEDAQYTWELQREEVPICGANDDDLSKAGFEQQDGGYVRRQTDDILAGTDENLEKPEGQFKSRVTLIVRWNAPTADQDSEFRVVTYLPVNGEEDQEGAGGADPETPGDPNAPPGAQKPGTPGNPGSASIDRSGGQKDGR